MAAGPSPCRLRWSRRTFSSSTRSDPLLRACLLDHLGGARSRFNEAQLGEPLAHEQLVVSIAQKSFECGDALVSMHAIEALRVDIERAYAQPEIAEMIARFGFEPRQDCRADTPVLMGRHDGEHLQIGTR